MRIICVLPFARPLSSAGYSNANMDRLVEEAVREVAGQARGLYEFCAWLRGVPSIDRPQRRLRHARLRGFIDNPVTMGIYYYPIFKKAGEYRRKQASWFNRLRKLYPDARELNYRTPLELLVATILSAMHR